jgi:hypothetical protein
MHTPVYLFLLHEFLFFLGFSCLQLSTKDAPTLWLSTQADNILNTTDMESLAYFWDTLKLTKVAKVMKSGKQWTAAADLALWCLQGNPDRRPRDMHEVLSHSFFDEGCRWTWDRQSLRTARMEDRTLGSQGLRYLESTTESWSAFVERQSRDLHDAIANNNQPGIEQLLTTGAVHLAMTDPRIAGSTVQTLHRAAYAGDVKTMELLVGELGAGWPATISAQMLDCRTTLGYTPLMIARACGHDALAELLESKGCTKDLQNDLGQTAHDLQDMYTREQWQQQVTPWRHGHGLWRSTNGLEAYLWHVEATHRSVPSVTKAPASDFSQGVRVWNAKLVVAHFNHVQMKCLIDNIRSRLPKSQDLALHFTDLETARNACLGCPGLRASTVGQLGGGLSVSLSLLDELKWAKGGSFGGAEDNFHFAMVVAGRLWGTKWYEVMPGEPPADLAKKLIELPEYDFHPQTLTEAELDAARGTNKWGNAVWGSCANKLEAAFLVRVPSQAKRDPGRVLPGRPDVYIIPQSDCVLFPIDEASYYPTSNIEALLMVQVPGDVTSAASILDELSGQDKLHRVQLTVKARDDAPDVVLGVSQALAANAYITDDVQAKENKADLRKIIHSYTAFVGSTDNVRSVLERHCDASLEQCVLWSESVARYTRDEMQAGITEAEQLIPHSHTMAFYYTTIAEAKRMCIGRDCIGGIEATEDIKLCLASPATLGWNKNAGGAFKSNVGDLMGLTVADIQVLIVLQVRRMLEHIAVMIVC